MGEGGTGGFGTRGVGRLVVLLRRDKYRRNPGTNRHRRRPTSNWSSSVRWRNTCGETRSLGCSHSCRRRSNVACGSSTAPELAGIIRRPYFYQRPAEAASSAVVVRPTAFRHGWLSGTREPASVTLLDGMLLGHLTFQEGLVHALAGGAAHERMGGNEQTAHSRCRPSPLAVLTAVLQFPSP